MLLGDIGTIFYIIIEGSLSLKIATFYEADLSAEELFLFLLENKGDIDWE